VRAAQKLSGDSRRSTVHTSRDQCVAPATINVNCWRVNLHHENRTEQNRTERIRTEPIRTEQKPIRTKPIRTEPNRTEPTEPNRPEPIRTDAIRTEPIQSEQNRSEPNRTEPIRSEPIRARNKAATRSQYGRNKVATMSQQGRNMVAAAPAGANLAARRWLSSRCQFARRRHPSPRGLHGCSSRQRGHLSQMRNFILRPFPQLQTDFYPIGCIVDFGDTPFARMINVRVPLPHGYSGSQTQIPKSRSQTKDPKPRTPNQRSQTNGPKQTIIILLKTSEFSPPHLR
jgi:hypothetical protein